MTITEFATKYKYPHVLYRVYSRSATVGIAFTDTHHPREITYSGDQISEISTGSKGILPQEIADIYSLEDVKEDIKKHTALWEPLKRDYDYVEVCRGRHILCTKTVHTSFLGKNKTVKETTTLTIWLDDENKVRGIRKIKTINNGDDIHQPLTLEEIKILKDVNS